MSRSRHDLAQDWEDWARVDPHFGILTDSTRRWGAWSDAEFFKSGREEVDGLLADMSSLGAPLHHDRALEFGCGLGRITHALTPHFREVVGVDVSPTMIARAKAFHHELTNIDFRCISDVSELVPERFDLVVSILVLQHLGSVKAILNTLGALASIVAPRGLLCVEIPDSLPPSSWRDQLRIRTRVYDMLRRSGVSPKLIYRLHLAPPQTMTAAKESEVRALLSEHRLTVLHVKAYEWKGVHRCRYFATPKDM